MPAGINQWDTKEPPRYLSKTSLSSRVGGLNPAWNEPQSSEVLDSKFRDAMSLTGSEFHDCVCYLHKVASFPLMSMSSLSESV